MKFGPKPQGLVHGLVEWNVLVARNQKNISLTYDWHGFLRADPVLEDLVVFGW